MFYSFSSMSTCFLSCFNALMMLALSSWARICLNIVFVLRSMCLGAFLACLCLDPCVYVLFSMFMPRSTCLSVHCHACGQIYIFECFMPCSCV